MMIATSSHNHNIQNSNATNGKRMMAQQAVEAPSYNDPSDDDADYVGASLSIGLNHRGTNTTSSSLPSKTVMDDHPVNKLNLYDLLYPGMNSNSKNTNATMKSRLQNQPLSPKKSTKHHHYHHHHGEGTTMMRRSASHDPQGVRNASWGVVSHKATAAAPSRLSYPFANNQNMATTTRTLKKQSSFLDSATKLQQGVNEMLDMLQSTTFVGTIDPLFHRQYLKTGEEKVDDEKDSMAMTGNEEEQEKHAWNLGSPFSTQRGREHMRMAPSSLPPTSMVVLVPNDVPSPFSSSVSLVSFTQQ